MDTRDDRGPIQERKAVSKVDIARFGKQFFPQKVSSCLEPVEDVMEGGTRRKLSIFPSTAFPPEWKRRDGDMEKILFVDDDPILLLLYQEELSEDGYEVLLARNGKDALEKYDQESPQLVVLNLRLKIMESLKTLKSLLDRNRDLPVILNTAAPLDGDCYKRWGAEAYVVKSSDLTELKEKIREALAKRKNRKGGNLA